MPAEDQLVVLLHGLGRTHRSMDGMGRHLETDGFRVFARSYPSRHRSIEELAEQEIQGIRRQAEGRKISAVTHSLGGILVRHMDRELQWERVVMLAPPNQGSRVARALKEHPLFGWFFGPAGLQVAEPEGWPAPPSPFGVIAGTLGPSIGNPPSWGVRSLQLLPPDEPHDGLVTLSETRHPAMDDFATVPASHTWIMDHPETRRLVSRFLRHGLFHPEVDSALRTTS